MPRSTDKPHPTAHRMAEAMARHAAEYGACTGKDLIQRGFSLDEIHLHGDTATALAARQSEGRAA